MSHAASLGAAPAGARPLAQRISNAKLGMWIFLASEVMFFAGLIGTYVVLRVSNHTEFTPDFLNKHFHGHAPDKILGGVNTLILIVSSLTMTLAVEGSKQGKLGKVRWLLLITALLGILFCGVKGYEYYDKLHDGIIPSTHLYFSCYYVTTGVHLVHVILGVLPLLFCFFMTFFSDRLIRKGDEVVELLGLYWCFVDLIWLILFPLLYLLH
ncbi:MAG: cytochrome c oxidase subunit 3 [Planctomycetota bacterium]